MPSAPWPPGRHPAASGRQARRVSRATRACLLALALLAASGCRSRPAAPLPPAWELDGYAGLSAQRELAGTGRATGSGPTAQSDARRAALAALVEQIEARVAARTSGVQTESARLERHDDRQTTTVAAHDERRREVSVSGEAALPGVRFEFATGQQDGVVVTWARAIVERELLIAADLADSRAGLAAAEAGLALAASVFGPGAEARDTRAGAPAALQALLAAERQLAAPAQALLRISAIAPAASDEAAQLAARLPALQRRQAELLAAVRERLHCEPDGAQPWIPFSGASLDTRWRVTLDGQPLPGAEFGAQLGQGPLAIARSDAAGRVHFHVPLVGQPLGAEVRLRVGPASDGRLGALHVDTLPQRTAIGAARLAIVTCRDVQHADDAPRAAEAAALRQRAAAALGNLGFTPVSVLPGCDPDVLRSATATADYVLTLRAHTRFRSQESGAARTPGPIWYGTRIDWRLQRVSDGLALSGHLVEEHARAAAGTAEAAALRSFELGLQRLLDPAAADSLPATLHGRLR